MEQRLQVVGGRPVDFRRPALQQLPNQLLGFVEATAQKLALRTFEPKAEHYFVPAVPIHFVEQCHAVCKIHARRRIGRRRLGLSPGAQVDRCHLRFFVTLDQPCAAPIELVRHIEQMLGEPARCHALKQHTSDTQVDFGTVLFRDECISRLLDPVVQELVGAIQAKDEPGVDGFPECRVHCLLCFTVNQG